MWFCRTEGRTDERTDGRTTGLRELHDQSSKACCLQRVLSRGGGSVPTCPTYPAPLASSAVRREWSPENWLECGPEKRQYCCPAAVCVCLVCIECVCLVVQVNRKMLGGRCKTCFRSLHKLWKNKLGGAASCWEPFFANKFEKTFQDKFTGAGCWYDWEHLQ